MPTNLTAAARRLLNGLSYRERLIIELRRGLSGEAPFTLEETAHVFKVTRERVRWIEKRAIMKLETSLGPDWEAVIKSANAAS